MWKTYITRLANASSGFFELFEVRATDNTRVASSNFPLKRFTQEVPWANNDEAFRGRHLRLDIGGKPKYWLWQSDEGDGEHVRFNNRPEWVPVGERVDGCSSPEGDRTLVVFQDGDFQLVSFTSEFTNLVRSQIGRSTHRLAARRAPEPIVPSHPRSRAIAFSVAGPPSDQKSTKYTDSGKRYEFSLHGGIVRIQDNFRRIPAPDLAISYDNRRLGEEYPPPRFDMIAASGGRVFAKVAGRNELYFAMMDDLYMHSTPSRGVFSVPSIYFKIDPEYNQVGARRVDLVQPLLGSFGNHPGAERFALYRTILELGIADVMIVRKQKRVWHKLDVRAPADLERVAAALPGLLPAIAALGWPPLRGIMALAEVAMSQRSAPGGQPLEALVPMSTYVESVYVDSNAESVRKYAVDYDRVLDIGVGHVHHYEQYKYTTGGELQPMQYAPYLRTYGLFNGPIEDGDGFIDGTCNFYMLVHLKTPQRRWNIDLEGRRTARTGQDPQDPPPHSEVTVQEKYAVLWIDEQSYVSQRWRLLDPRDCRGARFSIAEAAWSNTFFEFDPETYWSPFDHGHIGLRSRMAVAAQVILVTSEPDAEVPEEKIYSINYSWSTMDRSWRRRKLPDETVSQYHDADWDPATEHIEPVRGQATVFPQTIRLREDMTIVLRGFSRNFRKQLVEGFFIQRYLPATNIYPALPAEFKHKWRFVSKAVFALADKFSHFGIYDEVDSRRMYYLVETSDTVTDAVLAAREEDEWEDVNFSLQRWAPKISFSAPLHLFTAESNRRWGALNRKPLSLHNPRTRLSIVARGYNPNGTRRWIAMHYDKRDDDLLPSEKFDLYPGGWRDQRIDVTVRPGGAINGNGNIHLKLHPPTTIPKPPPLFKVIFSWNMQPRGIASIVLISSGSELREVYRIRMAGFVDRGRLVDLLDVDVYGILEQNSMLGGLEYRWIPANHTVFRNCVGRENAALSGTSIWIEDAVGNVAVGENALFLRSGGSGSCCSLERRG